MFTPSKYMETEVKYMQTTIMQRNTLIYIDILLVYTQMLLKCIEIASKYNWKLLQYYLYKLTYIDIPSITYKHRQNTIGSYCNTICIN
jgi:hypothetical protein